jgi:hypothetical protein
MMKLLRGLIMFEKYEMSLTFSNSVLQFVCTIKRWLMLVKPDQSNPTGSEEIRDRFFYILKCFTKAVNAGGAL